MEREALYDLLERLWDRYDREEFIADDPIAVPHRFTSRDDREIAGFLAATIAWGSRPMIVRNGLRMMRFLDDAPCDFVRNASERELATLAPFVHRTFNGGDLIHFIRAIRAMYARHGGLGRFVEASYAATGDMRRVLAAFREEFFRTEHPARCGKHVSSIERGASCKRLCMYFRWMVRRDEPGRGLRRVAHDPARGALYAARSPQRHDGARLGAARAAAERLAGGRGAHRGAADVRRRRPRALRLRIVRGGDRRFSEVRICFVSNDLR